MQASFASSRRSSSKSSTSCAHNQANARLLLPGFESVTLSIARDNNRRCLSLAYNHEDEDIVGSEGHASGANPLRQNSMLTERLQMSLAVPIELNGKEGLM